MLSQNLQTAIGLVADIISKGDTVLTTGGIVGAVMGLATDYADFKMVNWKLAPQEFVSALESDLDRQAVEAFFLSKAKFEQSGVIPFLTKQFSLIERQIALVEEEVALIKSLAA